MFGLLCAPCRELGPHQRALYRGFFCGVANVLSTSYGAAARLLVNRDAAFLSLLSASLQRAEPSPTLTTCCNPLARARPIFQQGVGPAYVAAVTMCGLETKLADDRIDEGRVRRRLAGMLSYLGSRRFDRARATLGRVDFPLGEVATALASQSAAEAAFRTEPVNFWSVARPTATAFAAIAVHTAELAERPEAKPSAAELGRQLGRITYLVDALDDQDDDRVAGRFNPLTELARRSSESGARTELAREIDRSLAGLRDALARLPLERYRRLLESLLVHSLPHKLARRFGRDALVGAPLLLAVDPAPDREQKSGSGCELLDCCNCCDCCDCSSSGSGGECCCSDLSCCDCGCCDCDCCSCDC